MQLYKRIYVAIMFTLPLLLPSLVIAEEKSTEGPGDFTLHVDVNLVEVPVTVIDRDGHPITQLRKEDFEVYEDGIKQEIQRVIVNKAPAKAVLLVDLSMSVQREAKEIRKAAYNFARALVAGSEIAVIGFSDEVELVQDWTGNLKRVNRALKKISPGLRTALYDALYLAASEQLRAVDGKKAIILLTDGLDNESRITYKEVQEALARSQAALYIICLTRMIEPEVERSYRIQVLARLLAKLGDKDAIKRYFEQKENDLQALSKLSGGRIFFPLTMSELHQAYGDVADEIRNKYSLTYKSSNPGARGDFRRISVIYRNPEARVLHRAGYYVTR